MIILPRLIQFITKMRSKNVPKPPYRHIVQLGDPILRCKCLPVKRDQIETPEFNELLYKMKKAMKRYKCVGLSAPQLGVNLQVIAISCPNEEYYYGSPQEYKLKQMQPYEYSVWINPSMKILDYEKITFPEGCESMRGFVADVTRYSRIQLSGWDENGRDKSEEMSGWLARIAQHEMDHLNGQMYLDIAPLSSLICSFWDRVNLAGGKIHLSFYPNKMLSK